MNKEYKRQKIETDFSYEMYSLGAKGQRQKRFSFLSFFLLFYNFIFLPLVSLLEFDCPNIWEWKVYCISLNNVYSLGAYEMYSLGAKGQRQKRFSFLSFFLLFYNFIFLPLVSLLEFDCPNIWEWKVYCISLNNVYSLGAKGQRQKCFSFLSFLLFPFIS